MKKGKGLIVAAFVVAAVVAVIFRVPKVKQIVTGSA